MAYKKYKTTNIKSSETDTKTDADTQKGPQKEYHFAGGGVYMPLTVKARSRAEAERLWQQYRKRLR